MEHAEGSVDAARNTLATSASFGNPQKFSEWFAEAGRDVSAVTAHEAKFAKDRADAARAELWATVEAREAEHREAMAAQEAARAAFVDSPEYKAANRRI